MILTYTFKFGLGKDLLNILQDLELKAKSGDDLLQECGKNCGRYLSSSYLTMCTKIEMVLKRQHIFLIF